MTKKKNIRVSQAAGINRPRRASYDAVYAWGEPLNEGGNATVYRCIKNDTREDYAIKIQREAPKGEKLGRFANEVTMMQTYGGAANGVLPIIEANVEEGWYVMPIALPIEKYFVDTEAGIKEKIEAIVQLAKSLEALHEQGITHRDIKPDNLFVYDGRFCFGDFGLCEFPEGKMVDTPNDRQLGAYNTIAPEMSKNPQGQDGKKADVYSLAKTMWILLTGDPKGFPGPYSSRDSIVAFSHFPHLKDEQLAVIELVLQLATDNDAESRMSLREFREILEHWTEHADDFHYLQHFEWTLLLNHIVSGTRIDISYIFDLQQIIHVLKMITSRRIANHVLLPGMGGLDLLDVEKANEEGCIYMYMQMQTILVRPKGLVIARYKDSDWSFLLLETEEQQPLMERHGEYEELVVEDAPGHYVPGDDAQYGVYNYDTGEKLPKGSKKLFRQLKGSFMIVPKSGNYNGITSTYDGRHDKMSAIELFRYVEDLKNGKEPETVYDPKPEEEVEHHWAPSGFEEQCIEEVEVALEPMKSCGESRISYAFYVHRQLGFTFEDMWNDKKVFLTKDGKFRTLKADEETIYRVYSREEAIEVERSVRQQCGAYYTDHGYEFGEIDCSLDIALRREGELEPRRFTQESIKTLMREADDRVNNRLVIDEYGRPQLLQNMQLADLYPVTQGTWCAGNRYVGKYSNLSDAEDSYHYMLQGWLNYITKSVCGKVNYVDGSIEELEKAIEQCYIENTRK